MNYAISVENLHKTYDSGTHALQGLSFYIEQGDFFGLLGPNGSGKTTMINIMSGATKKTSGELKIAGTEITEDRIKTKMLIGVVPQEISFDSFFTVNETLILQSGYYGIRNNQKRIDEILEKLNLQDKKNSNTRALSGGMKRRLLVAKALVHNPKILVLDEPTAGVDVELRHNLWHYMRHLNEDGLTILLTTHYLEEAESLCNKVAIINKGKLIALEKTKKLISTMGSHKILTLSFADEIQKIPEELQIFNAKSLNSHEIQLSFESKDINNLLKSLKNIDYQITDIEVESKNLEDVFIKLTHQNNG